MIPDTGYLILDTSYLILLDTTYLKVPILPLLPSPTLSYPLPFLTSYRTLPNYSVLGTWSLYFVAYRA